MDEARERMSGGSIAGQAALQRPVADEPDAALMLRLRKAVMAVGKDVDRYDDVVGALSVFFDTPGALGEGSFRKHILPLATEFDRAALSQTTALEAVLNPVAGAAFAMSPVGRLVFGNADFQRRFSCRPGGGVDELGVGPATFRNLVSRLRSTEADGPAILVAYEREREAPVFFVSTDDPAHGVILFREAHTGFTPRFAATLRDKFGLTAAECEILEMLAQSRNAEAIAEETGRALGTVRQHIKALLSKMSMSSQAQAVALVVAAVSAVTPVDAATRNDGDAPLEREVIRLANGRLVEVRLFGDPDGVPVMCVHGSIFGVGALEGERRAARAMGLKVIAPIRPGYGETVAGRGDGDFLELAASNLLGCMDHYAIDRAMLLTDGIGIIPAMRAICNAPDRFAAMVVSSPATPITEWARTHYMPARMRAHLWAARYLPGMSDMLISLGFALGRAKGFAVYPELVLGGPCFDLDVWKRPEYYPNVEDRCRLAIAQGPRATREDLAAINYDWSTLAQAVGIPVHLIQGRKNETSRVPQVEELLGLLEQGTLEIIEDAGLTVTLSHHELILRRVLSSAIRHNLAF